MRTFIAAFLLVLLAVPAAFAGGFATVGIDPAPSAAAPGSDWEARITVLQHGRTPAEGLRPVVLLRAGDRVVERFDARATTEPGVYTARVTFPAEGRYRVAVDEGFGVEHRFGTIAVSDDAATSPGTSATDDTAAPPSADDGSLAPLAVAGIAGVLASLLTAALVAARDRRRAGRPSTGPSPAAS